MITWCLWFPQAGPLSTNNSVVSSWEYCEEMSLENVFKVDLSPSHPFRAHASQRNRVRMEAAPTLERCEITKTHLVASEVL